MAAVQVWFHTGLTTNVLPKEPPVGYASETVSGTSVQVVVPLVAGIAVIETDAAIAYSCAGPAVAADHPVIPATSNKRYVVDVVGVSQINFIATA